ncbi:hypothetical protein ADICYQ_3749 [Cyclobacterium qasimii M12-11B]|uniref:Uncharacterized protein n=1 Tax=Cyclobacterium qasimii M12-11B TaxID=641524 RepID=S7WKF7_9BACT|nr:hypothetical protein ADICYQ_3749 [Cyclobacterium qasimii M12-11B]
MKEELNELLNLVNNIGLYIIDSHSCSLMQIPSIVKLK